MADELRRVRITDKESEMMRERIGDVVWEAVQNAVHEAMEDYAVPLEKIFITFAVSGELNPTKGKDIETRMIMTYRTLAGQYGGTFNKGGLNLGLTIRRELNHDDSYSLLLAIMDGLLGKSEALPDGPEEGTTETPKPPEDTMA